MKRATPDRLPPLLPAPLLARAGRGRLQLSPDTPIVLGSGADEGDFRSARALQDAVLRESGIRCPIESHARSEDLGPHVALARGDLPPDAPAPCRSTSRAARSRPQTACTSWSSCSPSSS